MPRLSDDIMSTKVQNDKRNQIIDMIKGIGIVLMVFRHARGPYSDFVLLFHMAIFFIASGYLYNEKSGRDVKSVLEYIVKKLKGLWVPYFGYTVAYILCNNIFVYVNFYTNNTMILTAKELEAEYISLATNYDISKIVHEILKAVFFRAETQMGGALWFLQTLFYVLIGYTIVEFIVRKLDKSNRLIIQAVVAIILLIGGWICQIKGVQLWGMNRVFSVYILIHIGVVLKELNIMKFLFLKGNAIIIFIIATFVLNCGYGRGYIALASNTIENPFFYLLMSISGWLCLYSIAFLLEGRTLNINACLAYISKHSVVIIGMHFLSFKIVNIVAVIMYEMEDYMIAAFPVLMSGGVWWVFYLFVGLIFPLLIEKLAISFGLKVKSIKR